MAHLYVELSNFRFLLQAGRCKGQCHEMAKN
jgi:hypothetical protein